MKYIGASLAFAATALAAARTSAPSGCLTVSSSGGDYDSIQDAVDSLSTSSSEDQCIFIDQGTYSEQVLVDDRSAQLTFYGYTTDTASYSGNGATITSSKSQNDGLSNDETATLRVHAANFKMYNVNVENAYGEGSQAVALSAYADSGYYGCAFTGFQDTLLANEGYQLYSNCMIQGATDFIFGQESPAWFEACDIRVLAKSVGYITANGRQSSSGETYYVFNNCDVACAEGESCSSGTFYLGRPWGVYARVVFQNSAMSDVINSAGWSVWNTDDERTDGVEFGEYNNSGEGAEGTRASFAETLDSAVSISTVLGSSYTSAGYYDGNYM
ncbi:pectinesterase [Pseudomassariella vexata]|uniref:Pectinesterase n=1 Tax=Pseudomassariella vexata TaxID=1141098 RepID=A0A1Y2DRC8_9PEZI|nr:pectinesterase [Pseudomassariella vexata]ORY61694.1 pectinesterase [Pseudomassariella vexata]